MTALIAKRPLITATMLVLLTVAAAFILFDLSALWDRLVLYGIGMQRTLHRDLAAAMRAVQGSETAALWSLISLGFLYGVFHAIGPGHGKVVISTYLATHESRLARGVLLSLLSSLAQGVTAIALVGGIALITERSLRDSQTLGISLEILSYGLVIMIGLFLAGRGARRLLAARSRNERAGDHGACGHAHGPRVADLEAPLSARHLLAMILSIGIRPCSGAILVLVLAFALQQLPAGIAAVAAMSLGTGLSISALAALSVYARKGAIALAGALDTQTSLLVRLVDIAAIAGGLLIAGFGLALLRASLAISDHPLL